MELIPTYMFRMGNAVVTENGNDAAKMAIYSAMMRYSRDCMGHYRTVLLVRPMNAMSWLTMYLAPDSSIQAVW